MRTTWEFDAIGTKWQIDVNSNKDASFHDELQGATLALIDEFDKTYSRFRGDSELMKWSRPGAYEMPSDGYKLFLFYEKLYERTRGKVTPLIGTIMDDAGYDANYSFVQKEMKPAPSWGDVLSVDENTIVVKQPVTIDVGAAGKGYLVDKIVELLCANVAVESVVVNAGGDIRHWSRNKTSSIRIGLENPYDYTQVLGVAEVGNGSLCASSGNRRKWGNLHHIIDPEQLTSPSEVVATWVTADEAMVADGLATALFFVQPAELKEFDFSYAILHKDGTLQHSPGLLVEVYTS